MPSWALSPAALERDYAEMRVRKRRVSKLVPTKLSLLGTVCKVSVYLSALPPEDWLRQYETQESSASRPAFPCCGAPYPRDTIITPS